MVYSLHEPFFSAFLICGALLVGVHLLSTLRSASVWTLSGLTGAAKQWTQTRISSWSMMHGRQQLDLVSQRCMSLMKQQQEERTRRLSKTTAHVVCLVIVIRVVNIFLKVPQWYTPYQDWVLISSMLTVVVVNRCPNLVRGKGTHAFYGLSMLFIDLWVVFGSNDPELVLTRSFAWIFRLVSSMVHLDGCITTFGITTGSLLDIFKHLNAEVQGNRYMSRRTLIVTDIFVALLTLFVIGLFGTSTHAEAHQKVKAAAHKIEQSAVAMLLDTLCDTALSLNSHFQMVSHSQKLAAMLMLESTQSLQGKEFTHYISPEDDQIRLKSLLQSSHGDGEFRSCALNVDMHSSNASIFGVEVFSVPFVSLDDSIHYMVGLREASDAQQAPLRSPVAVHPRPKKPQIRSQHVQDPAHHGTPPVILGTSLASRPDIDDDSSSRSDSSTGLQLILPTLMETSLRAKVITMSEVMASWNSMVPRRTCCTFHASQGVVFSVLRSLKTSPCIRNFHMGNALGCQSCGLLNSSDDADCACCGQALQSKSFSL